MIRPYAHHPGSAPPLARMGAVSPLAQLLHALNQPLTGLQCSMEVALASPRTPEQYVRGLREGLELTERMRALVAAIREVADEEEEKEKTEELETTELNALLREVVEDLGPIAEVRSVRLTLECPADGSSLAVLGGRRKLAAAVFRLLESALGLAARGTALRTETGATPAEAWIGIQWRAGSLGSEGFRPELGLLVAQAGWERVGAEWVRERNDSLETVTVRLPRLMTRGGDTPGGLK